MLDGGEVAVPAAARRRPAHRVLAHLRASKPPRPGSSVRFDARADADGEGFEARVIGRGGADESLYLLEFPADPYALLECCGHVPLPPYIAPADDADDERRYQTVFARTPGAIAAPTAALHFDAAVLEALAGRGVGTAHVTLHVGAGTFLPMRGADIASHVMHSERYEVGAATLAAIAATRARGGRVLAVGTTTLRALESAARGRRLRRRPGRRGSARRRRHRRRDLDLHHPRLRVPRRRPAADQLPPAEEHAADAGQRLRRP